MKPVDYLPGARRDYDESFDWYAERSAIAAQRFSNAVDATLNRIAAIDPLHRECLHTFFRLKLHTEASVLARWPRENIDYGSRGSLPNRPGEKVVVATIPASRSRRRRTAPRRAARTQRENQRRCSVGQSYFRLLIQTAQAAVRDNGGRVRQSIDHAGQLAFP